MMTLTFALLDLGPVRLKFGSRTKGRGTLQRGGRQAEGCLALFNMTGAFLHVCNGEKWMVLSGIRRREGMRTAGREKNRWIRELQPAPQGQPSSPNTLI